MIRQSDVVEIACPHREAPHAHARGWRSAHCLSETLRRALATEATTVVVDLRCGGDASMSLLAVLIDAKARARRSGKRLIMHGSPPLHRLAEICRLDRVLFPLEADGDRSSATALPAR